MSSASKVLVLRSMVAATLALGSLLTALMFLVTGCQTVPVTERRRLLVTSESSENEMGLTAY